MPQDFWLRKKNFKTDFQVNFLHIAKRNVIVKNIFISHLPISSNVVNVHTNNLIDQSNADANILVDQFNNRFHSKYIKMHLRISPFYVTEFSFLCENFLRCENSWRGSFVSCKPTLSYSDLTFIIEFNEESLPHIFNLFNYINKHLYDYIHEDGFQEFPENIFAELSAILDYLQRERIGNFKHIIPAIPSISTARVNPLLINSNTLTNFVLNSNRLRQKEIMQKTLDYLSKGEPADRENHLGERPLSIAVTRGNLELAKVLVAYDANLFKSCHFFELNAFELAKAYKQYAMLDTFTSWFIKVERPLPVKKIESIQFSANDKEVLSEVRFTDQQKIYTHLKTIADLTPHESQQLFELWSGIFDAKNARVTFDATFKAQKGNFVNLVKDEKGQIIGMVTYRIRKVQEDEVIVLIDFEFLARMREYSIIKLLSCGFPAALQKILKERVLLYCFIISEASFVPLWEGKGPFAPMSVPTKVPPFPKEKNVSAELYLEYMLYIYKTYFDGGIKEYCFNRANLKFSVRETEKNSVSVKTSQTKIPSSYASLKQEFYYRFRGGEAGQPLSTIELDDIFAATQMGKEWLDGLRDMMENKEIDAVEYVIELAKVLKQVKLIDQYVTPVQRDREYQEKMISCADAFFNQKLIEKNLPPVKSHKIYGRHARG